MSFVEMALVLPLLLLIGVAVADFGRAFYWGITLSQAARAGAAYGAQSDAKANDPGHHPGGSAGSAESGRPWLDGRVVVSSSMHL